MRITCYNVHHLLQCALLALMCTTCSNLHAPAGAPASAHHLLQCALLATTCVACFNVHYLQ